MSDSDIESYYQVSTAHSTSRGSFSEYSDVPSETAVDVIGKSLFCYYFYRVIEYIFLQNLWHHLFLLSHVL